MMADCSPLLLDLNENDPGIRLRNPYINSRLVFLKLHKSIKRQPHQRATALCTAQTHEQRFMMHASTSPFYPLFAALDITPKCMKVSAVVICGWIVW